MKNKGLIKNGNKTVKIIYSKLKKHKKIYSCIFIVLISTVVCTGYILSKGSESQEVDVKAVKVTELSEKGYTENAQYSGYVSAKDTKQLSFLVSGKIKSINVKEGDTIKEGQVLAEIDTSTIELDIENVNENIKLVQSSIEKLNIGITSANISLEETKNSYDSQIAQLQESYDNAKMNYERYKELYESGAVSQIEYEGKQLTYTTVQKQLETAIQTRDNQINIQQKQIESLNSDLDTAKIKLKQSQIALEQSSKNLEHAVIKAPCDGFVTAIPSKQGEVTASGSPVIVIKSGDQVINIGVSSSDYMNYKIGMEVTVEVDGEESKGTITNISAYPDEASKTYNVEITPENQKLILGNIVNIKIPIMQNKGYFIPISSVINKEGTNYIYILEKADSNDYYNISRQEVQIGDVNGENVQIKNFNGSAQVITDGVKYIKETDKVTIKE